MTNVEKRERGAALFIRHSSFVIRHWSAFREEIVMKGGRGGLAGVVVLLAVAVPAPGRDADKAPRDGKARNEELRQELLRRTGEDQAARKELIELMRQKPGADPEALRKGDLPVLRKLREIDRRNTAWLKEVV